VTVEPPIADNSAGGAPELNAAPWPRAVAWLAVAAHFCIADVIGVNSKGSKDDLLAVRDAAVLLAQADLLVVWLALGGSRWLRRVPWSLCGLAGVGLVLYMHNFKRVMGFVLAAYVVHLAVTVAAVGLLRFRGLRIIRDAGGSVAAAGITRQFTVADLFGAALAIAIAVSWVLRMERPLLVDGDGLLELFVVSAPMCGLTLIAALGMRRERLLVMQIVLAALVAALLTAPAHDLDKQLWLPYALHWLLVAATLWVFQMCGFRLVRTTTKPSASDT
jgi:hypothetical protein